MTDEVTVGLLGAGLIAGVHADAYRACPGVRLVAVADLLPAKAERLADRHAAHVVADVQGLLELGVDVIDICTPPRQHVDPALLALAAGRHVICEKPLARTMDGGRRVRAASERARGLLMVGHITRFEPDHRAARDLVESGAIGEVRQVVHSTASSLPGWSEGGWLADPAESGGPLLDQAVHSFDFARWIVGSPAVRVNCMAADTDGGPLTYALTTVRYDNGAIAHVESSWAHPAARGFKLSAEVVGTEGRLSWKNDHLMGGVLHRADGTTEWWDVLGVRGMTAELQAFFAAVRGGGPSPVPATDALESMRTALAAVESARTGRTIDLTAWEVS